MARAGLRHRTCHGQHCRTVTATVLVDRVSALERLRDELSPKLYQIFDLYVLRGQPARDVALALGISRARVYLARHRVQRLLRQEVRRLETRLPLHVIHSGN